MNFNVDNFKNVLKKATLNFSIESVQLKFQDDKVSSNMISEHRDAVTNISISNDIFDGKGNEYEFNFNQPSKQLMPFLNLIDGTDAELKIMDEKIIISSGRQKSNIHFCSPDIVSVFEGNVRQGLDYFLELDIDDTLLDAFAKIKKIGTQFGNIYFNVEKNKFNIETSDRTNRFSNNLKFDLVDIKAKDVSLRYDFKNFMNLMNVINGDAESFKMKFSYVESEGMGMLLTENEDSSEKYFLMSRRMENEI
jgi:hypothetical protein